MIWDELSFRPISPVLFSLCIFLALIYCYEQTQKPIEQGQG